MTTEAEKIAVACEIKALATDVMQHMHSIEQDFGTEPRHIVMRAVFAKLLAAIEANSELLESKDLPEIEERGAAVRTDGFAGGAQTADVSAEVLKVTAV